MGAVGGVGRGQSSGPVVQGSDRVKNERLTKSETEQRVGGVN